MGTIKLKSAEEWKEIFMSNKDITEEQAFEWLKDIQRNAIEYTLLTASQNSIADYNVLDEDLEKDINRILEEYTSDPIEVYVIKSSILNCKETIFKDNNL